MALEPRQLRYLLAVAEHGNFTRAAEELGISQPTLSQQIKRLEGTVGAQMLDRTGRTVRLTDAGEAYTHYARRALRNLAVAERAVHDVQDLSRGHLRLAVIPFFSAYLVGPLTAELYARHPGITLTVKELPQDQIESALLADDFDIGIGFFDCPHQQGITITKLYSEALNLVVGARSPQASHRGPLPVRDLAEYALAMGSAGFPTRAQFDAYCTRHSVVPRIVVEADSVEALTEIVQHTELATVLPNAVTQDHPQLTTLALDPALPKRTPALLWREGAYRSAATRAFTQIVHDLVQTRGYTRVST